VVVRNRALAGATAALAYDQARRANEPGALVIVAIGGNDVLGGTEPAKFAKALDVLLDRMCKDRRTVVMLELPLPPLGNAYGAAQRRLARRHGARLVPRRLLMGVRTSPDATLDTIHLSQEGHAQLAEAMWRIIRPGFSQEAAARRLP
jgi:acyl-CoA thioesterase-1